MDFYEMIGHYYNDLFPPSEAQINFLKEELKDNSQVLDLGCATGGYALSVAAMGHQVSAADLDEAMVGTLKAEALNRGLTINSFVMDLREVNQLQDSYDLIYCIGNTIVHLNDLAEVKSFIQAAYDQLKPGGKLLIQSVNYDRILKDHIQNLPDIIRESPKLTFQRHYEHSEGYIQFIGDLTLENEEETMNWTAQTRLLPILKSDLETIFSEVGFKEVFVFGDFKRTTFTLESPALVTLTVK